MGHRQGTVENLVIDPAFWLGRKVFVTGHTGFKGGWLCLWLQKLGAEVTGYALAPPTDLAIFNLASVNQSLFQGFNADVRDLDSLTKAMQASKPEIVIHMAAQSLVRDSYIDPVDTYSTNVIGTVHMFEAVRNIPSVTAVLNVTTDKCYENDERSSGYHENDSMGGHDPYSSSKGCAELITAAYRKSFFQEAGVVVASARAGNVIGGGDWAKDRLVPDAIRAFLGNKELLIRKPTATRPWQHVLEPLSGYLMLCQELIKHPDTASGAWNFGPKSEDTQPVSMLVEIMGKSWGNEARWKFDDEIHPHEAGALQLDCSKAKTELNWNQIWNLKRALTETVEWYKVWQNKGDMHDFTLGQIEVYQHEHSAQ